jgi:hypothetical protein
MTTRKALAERLGAAIKNLLAHQWSHSRPAMAALQELTDAAEAAREALAQPEPADEWGSFVVWFNEYSRKGTPSPWTAWQARAEWQANARPAAPPPPARPPTAAESAVLQDAAEGGLREQPAGPVAKWLDLGTGEIRGRLDAPSEQPAQWPEIVAAANKSVTGLGYPAIKAEQPALSDERILRLWSGDETTPNPRPVLGKNKVLAFGRAIERALKGTP